MGWYDFLICGESGPQDVPVGSPTASLLTSPHFVERAWVPRDPMVQASSQRRPASGSAQESGPGIQRPDLWLVLGISTNIHLHFYFVGKYNGQSCQKSVPLGKLLFLKNDKHISLQQAFDIQRPGRSSEIIKENTTFLFLFNKHLYLTNRKLHISDQSRVPNQKTLLISGLWVNNGSDCQTIGNVQSTHSNPPAFLLPFVW